MLNILVEEMQNGEEKSAIKLIKDCFMEFVAPGFSADGIEEFFKFANPDSMRKRLYTDNFAFIAKKENRIIGIIEFQNYNHICLLFVKKEYHNLGIAKTLFKKALNRCKEVNPELIFIDVNSSPYALPVYEKLGFIATGDEVISNGLRYIPMEYKI